MLVSHYCHPAQLRRILHAMVFVMLALAVPMGAQAQSFDIRVIARDSGVTGLPDVRIDLSKPAQKKYAVVVGNSAYSHVASLKNAASDARLVADYFRSADYVVSEFIDLDKQGFEAALRKMLFDVSEGDEVVFYFAGHGVQIGKANYIFPTDAELDSVYDVPFEAVSLTSLLSIVGARARSLVVILDSCRNNPFGNARAIVGLENPPAELETGFSPQNTPINSLLIYSTSPGSVAIDGSGANSPFTSAFVQVARQSPGQPLDAVMKSVRRQVYEATGGLQVPWESSSLVEPIVVSGDQVLNAVEMPGVAPMGNPDIRISAQLSPEVPIGDTLRNELGLPESAQIALANAPHRGRLEIAANGGVRGLTAVSVDGSTISGLTYSSAQGERPALINGSNPHVDQFRLNVDGSVKTVEVSLDVDPCDFHAGDYLDPQGVGLARYPNEIEPDAALVACQAAVRDNPDTGRFHYQLGRVLVALRQLDDAEKAMTKARDLGHTRAWYGLGLVIAARAKESGGSEADRAPNAALAAWAMGVDGGDPYAMHALGRQFLLYSNDQIVRRQGFDLMSRALEVGHTFSMNALGSYFLKEGNDHYDPARGLRYFQESAARGDIYGFNNMGYVALRGLGGADKDMAAAFEWFKKASDGGHPAAPTQVGRMYDRGEVSGRKDPRAALPWYDQGLMRGDAWGGVNGSLAIARNGLSGFTDGDAIARAAKAAVLRNKRASAKADEILAALGDRALDQGAQVLIAELGEDVVADGAFGANSQAALDRVAERFGVTFPKDRTERVKALASIYWTTTRFRADLY